MKPLDRPAWLPETAWPWQVHTLQTPAGRIAVTDIGTGPTVLLSHVGLWSFLWRDLVRALEGKYRVVTFDAPGTGLSDRPGAAGTSIESAATHRAQATHVRGVGAARHLMSDHRGLV